MFREFDAATGLHAGVWEPTTPTADAGAGVPTVLAIHGITSSHRAWAPMARQLPDVRIVAPDLDAESSSLAPPAGDRRVQRKRTAGRFAFAEQRQHERMAVDNARLG